MTRSEALFERACKVIPGGVNSPVRAFGSIGGTPRMICAVSSLGSGVVVEFVEAGHAQCQIGVGEEFDGLGSHIIDGDNPAASALSL